jgi:hypothetical protein
MSDLQIACTLSDAELRDRRETVLRKIRGEATEVKEVENGFAYQFSPGHDRIVELAHFIDLERQCCPFLKFELTIAADNGPVRLAITGPEGAKEFLSEILNSAAC